MKQTQNTHILSGERGGGVLSGVRGKEMAVTWAGRENSETADKQKQLPSASLDCMRAACT